jgi:hypothetical protein
MFRALWCGAIGQKKKVRWAFIAVVYQRCRGGGGGPRHSHTIEVEEQEKRQGDAEGAERGRETALIPRMIPRDTNTTEAKWVQAQKTEKKGKLSSNVLVLCSPFKKHCAGHPMR